MIETVCPARARRAPDSLDCLHPCLAVGKNTRNVENLSEPAAIVFLFDLDGQTA